MIIDLVAYKLYKIHNFFKTSKKNYKFYFKKQNKTIFTFLKIEKKKTKSENRKWKLKNISQTEHNLKIKINFQALSYWYSTSLKLS